MRDPKLVDIALVGHTGSLLGLAKSKGSDVEQSAHM